MRERRPRHAPSGPDLTATTFHAEGDPAFVVRDQRVVQCIFYADTPTGDLPAAYARCAHRLLTPHGLELRLPDPTATCIPLAGLSRDFDDREETATALLGRAKEARDEGDRLLPVIFCRLGEGVNGAGETFPRPCHARPQWDPGERYVLLYVNHPSADAATLLHEIGHAAGQSIHDEWGIGSPDERYSVMGSPGHVGALFDGTEGEKNKDDMRHGKWARNTLYRPLVEKIAAAPWTVAEADCRLPPLRI